MLERYSTAEMKAVWSQEGRLEKLVRVELVWIGVLSGQKVPPLRILPRDLLEKEARTRHEMAAVVDLMEKRLAKKHPRLLRFLHHGLTSSDVLDTALALQMRESLDLLAAEWKSAAEKIKTLALRHQATWMAGRTHGMHAEPTTFGAKLAGWHAEALRNIERLDRVREEVGFGKFSGAVGNYGSSSPEREKKACRKLGLRPEPAPTQVIPRDRHAAYLSALALSGAALERFALEIRHLQRTEIGELQEPFESGQKGSSAMPHKKNPVLCENLCGLARVLRAYAQVSLENVALWHERDISHSSAERLILPDASLLLHFMLKRFRLILDGLKVNVSQMRANLDKTRWLIFSEQVLLALMKKGLKRSQAYRLVQECAFQAEGSDKNFREILCRNSAARRFLSLKELDRCFDLESYRPGIRALFKRL